MPTAYMKRRRINEAVVKHHEARLAEYRQALSASRSENERLRQKLLRQEQRIENLERCLAGRKPKKSAEAA